MAILANAVTPCVTPTHDGSGQGMHPSVIDFLTEHGLASWAGHRFWMAMSPYTGGNDVVEDPNLIASDDGETWVVPDGLTNPLDDRSSNPTHLNDPYLVYDPTADNLRVYYGEASAAFGSSLLMKTVDADMIVSEVTTVLHSASYAGILGHTVWRESESAWHLWYCSTDSEGVLHIAYRVSANGIDGWSDPAYSKPQIPPGWYPWHLGGKPNIVEQRMELFVACTSSPTISSSILNLRYLTCDFADPTHVYSPLTDWALIPSVSGWDNYSLYQSSPVLHADGTFDLWYSGRTVAQVWHTAMIAGASLGVVTSAAATCLPADISGNQARYFDGVSWKDCETLNYTSGTWH